MIEEIVEHLNLELGTRYRATGAKTKSLINARVKEGASLTDFKIVITKMKSHWAGTNMEIYLRPETLFGNKFEGYLNRPWEISEEPRKKTKNEQSFDVIKEWGEEQKAREADGIREFSTGNGSIQSFGWNKS